MTQAEKIRRKERDSTECKESYLELAKFWKRSLRIGIAFSGHVFLQQDLKNYWEKENSLMSATILEDMKYVKHAAHNINLKKKSDIPCGGI